MRFRQFVAICASGLIKLALSRPVGYYTKKDLPLGRDLLGLLGGADPNLPSPAIQGALITPWPTEYTTAGTSVSRTSLVSTRLVSAASTSNSAAPTRSTAIGIITSISATTTRPDPATVIFSTTSYNIGYVSEAPTTPPAELTEWKVIGIAVITITFIAIVTLAVAFFDSWWGFLCDSLCGKRRKAGEKIGGETLVPDWGKRSWEFRLANEDGHRYPTINSLESIAKEKERVKEVRVRDRGDSLDVELPETAYDGIL